MARATWSGAVIAESDHCQLVEGNCYFPPDSVRREFLQASDTHSVCPWKGTASYCHVTVDGNLNPDAAWFYPDPKPAAANIRDYIAFWKGIHVQA